MSDKINHLNQINDKCPHCPEDNKGFLHYRNEYYPYNIEHLSCNKCESVFTLNYKPLWYEDKISLTCDMIEVLENEFKKRKIEFPNNKNDELFELLTDFLEEFTTGEYKNHM